MGHEDSGQGRQPKSAKPSVWVRVASVILCASVGIAAFYGFENWRGNKAWQLYVERVRAKGGSLELAKRPDTRGGNPEIHVELKKLTSVFDPAEKLVPSHSGFTDLIAYAGALAWLRAGDTNHPFRPELGNTNRDARARGAMMILEAFSTNTLLFEKLDAALHGDAYPLGYESSSPPLGPVPYVFTGIEIARLLWLKGTAELAAGRTTDALWSLDLAIRLSESLARDPSLIASVGGIACRGIGMRIAQEGLAEHRFSAAELVELQRIVASTNLIRRQVNSILVDRNHFLPYIDDLQPARKLWEETGARNIVPFAPFLPSGWRQLEKVNLFETYDQLVAAACPGPLGLDSAALEKAEREMWARTGLGPNGRLTSGALWRHTALAALFIPKISAVAHGGASAQVATDQIWLGAKLEHYCLQHGTYPERLEEVAESGQTIPLDPFTNRPYRYQREPGGGYKLWSVGRNQKDDEGKPDPKPFDNALTKSTSEGDWVLSVGPRTL